MKAVNAVRLLSLYFVFTACSGSGGGGIGTSGLPGPLGIIPNFNEIIDTNACFDPMENTFGEDKYYEKELWQNIKFGDASCAKKAIEVGKLDVNKPIVDKFDNETILPIWMALDEDNIPPSMKSSSFAVIKVLVDAGAKINMVSDSGETTLLYVLKHVDQKDHPSVAQYLIQTKKINLDYMDNNGRAAIHYIVDLKNPITIDELLKQKPNLNLQASNGNYPIFQAINNKWLEGTQKLIAGGADIEVTDGNSNLPLHSAIREGLTPAAKTLAHKLAPAKRNQTNSQGQTALWLALQKQNYEVAMDLLVNLKVDVNIGNSESAPLHLALQWNNVEVRKIIVDRVAPQNIDAKDANKNSGIHIATTNHDMASLKTLLKRGANPNATNGRGKTPLIIATQLSFTDAMTDLINAKANLNEVDAEGNTALHYAKSPAVAQLLVNAGADFNIVNNDQKTPIVGSAFSGSDALFMYFAGINAKVDWTDADNRNLLHIAAGTGMPNAVTYLVQKIDVNSTTNAGKTPLFSANNLITFNTIHAAGGKIDKEELTYGDNVFTSKVRSYLSNQQAETLAIIYRLIELKADTNHRLGTENETILFYATRTINLADFDVKTQKRFPELYKALMSSDINVNAKSKSGKTALFDADTVEEVTALKKGSKSGPIDTSIKDVNGKSAINYKNKIVSDLKTQIGQLTANINILQGDLQKAIDAGKSNAALDIEAEIHGLESDKKAAQDLLQDQELILKAMQ